MLWRIHQRERSRRKWRGVADDIGGDVFTAAEDDGVWSPKLRTFSIIVEPPSRITNVRNSATTTPSSLSGSEDIPTDVVRHSLPPFLLDPLPLMYPHIIAEKRPGL